MVSKVLHILSVYDIVSLFWDDRKLNMFARVVESTRGPYEQVSSSCFVGLMRIIHRCSHEDSKAYNRPVTQCDCLES